MRQMTESSINGLKGANKIFTDLQTNTRMYAKGKVLQSLKHKKIVMPLYKQKAILFCGELP